MSYSRCHHAVYYNGISQRFNPTYIEDISTGQLSAEAPDDVSAEAVTASMSQRRHNLNIGKG